MELDSEATAVNDATVDDEVRPAQGDPSSDPGVAVTDPDWDCTVLCSRLLSCGAASSKLEADDDWLLDKSVEGCEASCAGASEEEQAELASLAACDASESCADFYACVQSGASVEG